MKPIPRGPECIVSTPPTPTGTAQHSLADATKRTGRRRQDSLRAAALTARETHTPSSWQHVARKLAERLRRPLTLMTWRTAKVHTNINHRAVRAVRAPKERAWLCSGRKQGTIWLCLADSRPPSCWHAAAATMPLQMQRRCRCVAADPAISPQCCRATLSPPESLLPPRSDVDNMLEGFPNINSGAGRSHDEVERGVGRRGPQVWCPKSMPQVCAQTTFPIKRARVYVVGRCLEEIKHSQTQVLVVGPAYCMA